MMLGKPILIRLCLLFLVALLATGCASLSRSAAPTPLTLKAILIPQMTFAPYFVAIEEGFFAEQGIILELIQFNRSADGIPALAQGQLDVFGGSLSFGFLNAITRGANIRLVADKGYTETGGCYGSAIIGRKALVESGITRPSQYKGLTFALNPTNHNGYYVDHWLQREGLQLEDVKVSDIADTLIAEAMNKGTLDAAAVSEPMLTRILQSDEALLLSPSQAETPDLQYAFVAFGPNLLAKNPDAGQRFMVAYLKGIQQYSQGKTERNLDILVKHTQLDRELLKQVCWPPFRPRGEIKASTMLEFQQWAVNRGYLDTIVTEDKLWDGRFVKYAAKTLNLGE